MRAITMVRGLAGALALCLYASAALAQQIPIEHFARLPALDDVTISPDGRYIAMIRGVEDLQALFVVDLKAPAEPRAVLGEDKKREFQMTWCKWGNATRLICGYRAMKREASLVYPITRMVAVNADGSEQKILIQNGRAGGAQLQDRVLDFTPDEPETVLVQVDDDRNGFPSVFALNIYTGSMALRVRERSPIRSFVSDGRGNVRLGFGLNEGTERSFFARMADETSWVQLAKFKAFSESDEFRPVAVSSERNTMYAIGSHEGRDALWAMDLNDAKNPELIFSHPEVDVDSPILAMDGRMLGVLYQTDRPFAFYTDADASRIVQGLKAVLPAASFNSILDRTLDGQSLIIRSSSDIDAGTYHLLTLADGRLRILGSAYPELLDRSEQLSRMQSIAYPAQDGTQIPGYLTVPAGRRAENLPLVVMPHGGPIARDTWSFDWVAQFLASRGYAVLQMNFRGSSGYGDAWYSAAHQDWGGLTQSDITDAARWAIAKGIADPQRVCIVGWSFGGYAALLGAVRNGDLYKCAVSIAGVSDLIQILHDEADFIGGAVAREQIGRNTDKLKSDSPLRHIDKITMPVLLVHGDMDYQVRVEHSRRVAKALHRAKKPHRYVEIEDANHQLSRASHRMKLLSEIESFLQTHLGAGL